MPLTDVIDARLGGSTQLRNEPVQARSTARLTALLDAAAAAIQEFGYERLTTAMVAERAGASIGTVYRYFPDRIAVLQALSSRNLERVLTRIHASFDDAQNTDWRSALSSGVEVYIDFFRNEPGFSSLRSGDVLDLRPATTPTTFNSQIGLVIFETLSARFGLADTPEARFNFEKTIEVLDSLVARAFARDAQGDPAYLESARSLVLAIAGEGIA